MDGGQCPAPEELVTRVWRYSSCCAKSAGCPSRSLQKLARDSSASIGPRRTPRFWVCTWFAEPLLPPVVRCDTDKLLSAPSPLLMLLSPCESVPVPLESTVPFSFWGPPARCRITAGADELLRRLPFCAGARDSVVCHRCSRTHACPLPLADVRTPVVKPARSLSASSSNLLTSALADARSCKFDAFLFSTAVLGVSASAADTELVFDSSRISLFLFGISSSNCNSSGMFAARFGPVGGFLYGSPPVPCVRSDVSGRGHDSLLGGIRGGL